MLRPLAAQHQAVSDVVARRRRRCRLRLHRVQQPDKVRPVVVHKALDETAGIAGKVAAYGIVNQLDV